MKSYLQAQPHILASSPVQLSYMILSLFMSHLQNKPKQIYIIWVRCMTYYLYISYCNKLT